MVVLRISLWGKNGTAGRFGSLPEARALGTVTDITSFTPAAPYIRLTERIGILLTGLESPQARSEFRPFHFKSRAESSVLWGATPLHPGGSMDRAP